MQGKPCDIDPDCENHEDYLGEFKSMLMTKLRNSIDRDLANDPDCIKGRRKTVQVIGCRRRVVPFHATFNIPLIFTSPYIHLGNLSRTLDPSANTQRSQSPR